MRQALASSELGVRLAVLRSLGQDLTPALKLEVDLRKLYCFPLDVQEGLAWAALLRQVPDADDALLDLLTRASHPSIMAEAARGLSTARARLAEPLGRLLQETADRDRKRVVASLLVGVDRLDPELRLLVSLWAQAQIEPPALDLHTRELWCHHLDHPRARAFVEQGGVESAGLLMERLSNLSSASRRWLLTLAVDRNWRELGPGLLAQDDEDSVVAGLQLGAGSSARWTADSRARVRAAALLHGELSRDDWRACWDRERDLLVLRALLRAGRSHLSSGELVELLKGHDWELRSLATEELSGRSDRHAALSGLDSQDPVILAALHRLASTMIEPVTMCGGSAPEPSREMLEPLR